MNKIENYNIVEDNIEVRLNPSIYSFSTNTIPSYLKVGDTFRGVDTRIAEWYNIISKKLYPTVVKLTKEYEHSAVINDKLYYRDFAVHKYLEEVLDKKRITDPALLSLYSQEYFKDITVSDLDEAINAIEKDCLSDNIEKCYTFYKIDDRESSDFHYKNDKIWKPRPNQEIVINNFLARKDKPALLMFAVMRFGKSFTAMQCALQSGAKKVLIVSAKADVLREWQKTVEMPKCFEEYNFLYDKDFKNNIDIDKILNGANKNKVAIFLTLQNLCGKGEDGQNIKARLNKVFNINYDLIIIDETHYGAWANTYGKPLKNKEEDIDCVNEEQTEREQLISKTYELTGKQKLHLSGTPYNLLFDNKFDENNIIATCQFKDILEDKEKWDNKHFLDIENGVENSETGRAYQEFDNPYFGFPKMLRFAFNLPQSARDVLSARKKEGKIWSLSELFKIKINEKEVNFLYEKEVLNLLKVIDGTEEDDEILSFLNVPKIKDNDVCKHMVFALPYKYSCDALEQLLEREKSSFINLSKYNVLNITGHNVKQELNNVDKVKLKISEYEKIGQKTLTLTVNKMLTGVTVKEWDTMVMLKSTKSPQEYDQAVFRIQNQYVLEYVADDGSIIKKDMKPQTILVDFDPIRMFELQGLSTQIVNKVVNNEISLDDSIKADLRFFPIITYNAKKLVKVEPTNIIEIITKYNSEKSIMDEVQSVEMDEKLLEDKEIEDFIIAQSKLDLSNKLTTDAHRANEDSDIDSDVGGDFDSNGNNVKGESDPSGETKSSSVEQSKKDLIKKYRMCIAGLSFYAFLTKSNIDTLQDILSSIDNKNEYAIVNQRIFKNLNLNEHFINKHIVQCSKGNALYIDNVIKKSNMLSKDEKLSEVQRAKNAINRFSRISDSEIVTPINICIDMLNGIGIQNFVDIVNSGNKILDIAGKTGEFTFALYNLLKNKVDIEKLNNAIYTIPTSTVTYEFTRRMYEVLGLKIENIAEKFNSYSMINDVKKEKPNNTKSKTIKKDTEKDIEKVIDYDKVKLLLTQNKPFNIITMKDIVREGEEKVKFDAIVGNPPYQIMDGGAKASATPIYNKFVNIAKYLNANYISMIIPTRWFAGGKGLDEFREEMLNDKRLAVLHDYLTPEYVFPNTNNRGGICYFLRDLNYDNSVKLVRVITHKNEAIISDIYRSFKTESIGTFIRHFLSISIINKVYTSDNVENLVKNISPRKPFGIESNIISTDNFKTAKVSESVKCYAKSGKKGYVDKELIKSHTEWVNLWKVYFPRANNIGTELNDDNFNGFIGEPSSICTEAFMFIGIDLNLTKMTALNLVKYMRTKFARYMHSLLKVSHDATSKTFKYVPLQDFTEKSDIDWNKSIAEIDKQLYTKYGLDDSEIAFIESMIKPME